MINENMRLKKQQQEEKEKLRAKEIEEQKRYQEYQDEQFKK